MTTAAYPDDLETDVVLRDGSTLHVRPVRAADRDGLLAFLEALSPESRLFRFFTGGGNLEKAAAIDPKTQKPVSNPARQIWVTETALTTALNTAYFAESVALFAIIVGVALMLVGVGFLVFLLVALRRPVPAPEKGTWATSAAPSAS